jgi:hypothetical protein
MGSSALKGHVSQGVMPFDSPLRLGLQQGEEFIGRPELAFAQAWRHNRFDSLQLFGGIGSNVDLRGGQVTVPQP